jgi:hypothetical protein
LYPHHFYDEIPRLAQNDNTFAFFTPFVMLSAAEASLCTFNRFIPFGWFSGNHSLQFFPIAMQRFSVAFWKKLWVHRNTWE